MSATRRAFLAASAAAPIILGSRTEAAAPADDLPPPKYYLAMNLEIIFPRTMPYEQRIAEVAKCGAKHYGFWGHVGRNLDAMLEAQKKHDLTCVSITGAPRTGNSTGLTATGKEQAFLDDFEGACKVAKRFGAENLITFVGVVQKEIPWETQETQIVEGLKKAGDLAEKYGVYVTLEPLNRVESPRMTMVDVHDSYKYAIASGHPRVKVDFDIYHRALGQGNILNTLKEGIDKGLVRFVEVGDVPGRKEPGSGETNYANIFKYLRQVGFAGAIGMECGSTRDPQYAWDATKALAGL